MDRWLFKVVTSLNKESKILKSYLAGLEEEGMPYEVEKAYINKTEIVHELHNLPYGMVAYIEEDEIIVLSEELKEKPLFRAVNFNIEISKLIGINTVRFIKKVPIKGEDIWKILNI